MRIFVMGAEGVIGARLATQLIDHGHQVIGSYKSPRNAGRLRGHGPEPTALGQPARVRPRIAGSS